MRYQEVEERIYATIGQFLIDSCDQQSSNSAWDAIVLRVEHSEEYTNYTAEILTNGKFESMGFAPYDITDHIEELKQYSIANKYTKWNQFVFKLFPDLNFTIQFEWDTNLEDE